MPTDYKATLAGQFFRMYSRRSTVLGSNITVMSSKNKKGNQTNSTALVRKLDALTSKVNQLNRVVPATKGSVTNRANIAKSARWSTTSVPLRIKQVERISTFFTDTNGYHVEGWYMNPGNAGTFPWLSRIAGLYDKYKFHKLHFKFVPSVPTTTPGAVMFGIDFDTLDKPPLNSLDLSNLAQYKVASAWDPLTIEVQVNRRGNRDFYYTYDGNASLAQNIDLKTYNLGNMFIACEGVPANTTLGYLVVDYDVELIDKNYFSPNDQDAGATNWTSWVDTGLDWIKRGVDVTREIKALTGSSKDTKATGDVAEAVTYTFSNLEPGVRYAAVVSGGLVSTKYTNASVSSGNFTLSQTTLDNGWNAASGLATLLSENIVISGEVDDLDIFDQSTPLFMNYNISSQITLRPRVVYVLNIKFKAKSRSVSVTVPAMVDSGFGSSTGTASYLGSSSAGCYAVEALSDNIKVSIPSS